MKFIKNFSGVRRGEIYPTEFEKGEDCPLELELAAMDCGAVKRLDQDKDTSDKNKQK